MIIKLKKRDLLVISVIFLTFLIVPFVYAAYTGVIIKGLGGEIWITNRNPTIKLINVTAFQVDPTSGGATIVLLSFNASDADGVSNINASKVVVNFTLGVNGQWRSNVSDVGVEFGTCYNHTENNANVIINCTVVMQYYDNASSGWVINVSIKDINGGVGRNDSNGTILYNFTYNQLSAMSLSSAIINFSNANLGDTNIPAGGVTVVLNNTGNDDFDQINITGAAYIGVDITSQSIAASQFFVNYTNAVDGAGMPLSTSGQTIRLLEQSAADRLDNLTLPHGHTSAKTTYGDNAISAKGNQSLYFWVDIPSSGLSSQKYNNTWNISVIDLP